VNKLNEFFFKYDWVIIRFLIILFLAILINVYLIPDRKIIADNIPQFSEGNQTYYNLSSFNVNQLIQNSIDSGNIIEIFWNIAYFGYGTEEFCFGISESGNMSVSVNQTILGIVKIKDNNNCFYIGNKDRIEIPNYIYSIPITITQNDSQVSAAYKDMCIPGKTFYCDGSYCAQSTQTFYNFPKMNSPYFEADGFHKMIKFLWVLLLSGLFIWNVTRVYIFIRDGLKK
jgi:hypothetical protein